MPRKLSLEDLQTLYRAFEQKEEKPHIFWRVVERYRNRILDLIEDYLRVWDEIEKECDFEHWLEEYEGMTLERWHDLPSEEMGSIGMEHEEFCEELRARRLTEAGYPSKWLLIGDWGTESLPDLLQEIRSSLLSLDPDVVMMGLDRLIGETHEGVIPLEFLFTEDVEVEDLDTKLGVFWIKSSAIDGQEDDVLAVSIEGGIQERIFSLLKEPSWIDFSVVDDLFAGDLDIADLPEIHTHPLYFPAGGEVVYASLLKDSPSIYRQFSMSVGMLFYESVDADLWEQYGEERFISHYAKPILKIEHWIRGLGSDPNVGFLLTFPFQKRRSFDAYQELLGVFASGQAQRFLEEGVRLARERASGDFTFPSSPPPEEPDVIWE